MPQLVKGGKWVFGWSVASPRGTICIPPAAFNEYGFVTGEHVLYFHGSRTSGGFGVGRKEKLSALQSPILQRSIGEGVIQADGLIRLPPDSGIIPGDRLLVVRGSGLALGFIQFGPIIDEALKHADIEIFTVKSNENTEMDI
ncbi:MAG: hypothetical protein JXR32_05205 [Anaerolineaceae bacterium]|nr:hypothetical protein [Anaerolineaceae bacterium]